MSNNAPIEDRIEEAIHGLLNHMDQESDYSDDYKSMFTHLTKVMELRQKQLDGERANDVKMKELQQQRELSDIATETKLKELEQQRELSDVSNETKLKELEQQRELSEVSNDIRTTELEQQKSISDDANRIKLEELELRKTITKEALLNVATHVAGLIVLMNHERAHVIASKAFGFVKRIF